MDTQEITLTQDSSDGLYTQLLRGRYVTSINDDCVTLDNGLVLTIEGNEGCMACANGWYHLEQIFKQGNSNARIMSAHVEHSQDNNYSAGCEIYTIFVMVDGNPHQLPLATIRGADGPGGYGTGFTLTATVQNPTLTSPVALQNVLKAVAAGKSCPTVPNMRTREDFLNAVAYTLYQTRGCDSPLRITGPEAQLFRDTATTNRQNGLLHQTGTWNSPQNMPLFWFADDDSASLVLRDFTHGTSGYLKKLQALMEQIYAHDTEIKTYVTGYALKGNTATVNGTRVPATDLLLSEICGWHRLNGKVVPTFHYADTLGARIIKHRGGGRGDVTLISRTQNVWAINPQEDTTL